MNGPGALLSLDGRAALVAGGGGGIGSAVARLLVAAGARVAVADLPGRVTVEGTEGIPCDLSRAEGVRECVAEAGRRLGRLDVVVHAAGVTRDGVLWKMDDTAWSDVLRVNLDSAFWLLRESVPLLRGAGGGSIVLISSINGERGKFGQANYAASKAGLLGLARSAAREVGRFGIRVNVVAPGWIDTPMNERLPPEFRDQAVQESALGRAGEPGDVAAAVLFLASAMSHHVTGQVLRVDGGQLIA